MDKISTHYFNDPLLKFIQRIQWIPAIVPVLYLICFFNPFVFNTIFVPLCNTHPEYIEKFINGGVVYILPCFCAITITLCLCIFFASLTFFFQNHYFISSAISRLPNLLLETFPQIFWLYIISFTIDTSNNEYYIKWYIIIAITYSPIIIDQLNSRINDLREKNFILAETMVGQNRFVIFFRDIVWYYCIDIMVVQSVYLISSIISMEACMAFLMRISPDNSSSLGTLLNTLYFADIENKWTDSFLAMITNISTLFWLTLIVIISTIFTLNKIASSLEQKWTLK